MKTKSLLKPPKSKILKSGRVILSSGEEIGIHSTDEKEEIIIVLCGVATLQKEEKEIKLTAGETHYIKKNTIHNVLNNSKEDLEYIYVVGLK